MASSNSYDFTVTRDEIINLAHQHISALGEGETCTAAQITEASKLLNMIVKLRATDGMPTWALKTGYILPLTGVSSIVTDSHVVTRYDNTTISADEASGQTVISVVDGSSFSALDQIGIEQDDGSVHWTTVVSVASNDITITAALTANAALGNQVYGYTASVDRIQKPIRILSAYLLEQATSVTTELDIYTQEEYFDLSNRTSEGDPQAIYYSIVPSSDTALDTNGRIRFYPRFQNGKSVIEFIYQRPFQDFDASTDTPDFPQSFHLPLMLELASILGTKFGLPINERKMLFAEAATYREEALSSIYSEGSLKLQPDTE